MSIQTTKTSTMLTITECKTAAVPTKATPSLPVTLSAGQIGAFRVFALTFRQKMRKPKVSGKGLDAQTLAKRASAPYSTPVKTADNSRER